MIRSFGLAALAGVLVLGAACNGGGGNSATPTQSPATQLTPFATPKVTGNQIDSEKGYTATFPAGWKVRPNFINTQDATVDAFFQPLQGTATPGQVQANIAVTCILQPQPAADFLSASQTRTARLPQDTGIEVSQTTISGVDATVVTYRFDSKQDTSSPPLDKQDIMFTDDRCNWTITTTAPAGQRAAFKADFDSFINSFHLK